MLWQGFAWRLAVAVLAPLVIASVLAPPTPWPLHGRLFDYVDHVGHYWHYWDFARSLAGGDSLFSSTSVYFPLGADHLLHRGGHLLVVLSWPLIVAGADPALAHNLLTVLALLVTSAAGALLGWRASPSLGAMLVGATALGFNRALYWQLRQGQSEEVMLGLIVIFLLALQGALQHGGWRRLVIAGAMGALCAYANLVFGVFLVFLLGLGALALGVGRSREDLLRWSWRAFLAGSITLVAAAPLIVAFVAHYQASLGSVTVGMEGTEPFVILQDFVELQRSFAVTTISLAGDPRARFDYRISGVLIGLAALGLWKAPARQRWLWGSVSLLFFTLSLGPDLQHAAAGTTGLGLRLPLYWFDRFMPFMARIHFPGRFLAVAHIGLAALAAHGVQGLVSWSRDRPRLAGAGTVVLALIVGFEQQRGTSPDPITEAPGVPLASTMLFSEPGSFAVIEVPPFTARSRDLTIRYLQRCIHGKPMMDAMGEEFLVPGPLRQLQRENPLLDSLWASLDKKTPRHHPSRVVQQADAQVLGDIGFRYLVVHRDEIRTPIEIRITTLLSPWLGAPAQLGDDDVYTIPSSAGPMASISGVEESQRMLMAYLEGRSSAP